MHNFIEVYDEAFAHEFCDRVITYYENMCAAGFGSDRRASNIPKLKVEDETVFPSQYAEIDLYPSRELVHEFNTRLYNFYSEYCNKYSVLFEGAKPHILTANRIQKTLIGQGYHLWHFESSSRDVANRVAAFTLYLNDVNDGGETEFLYYPIRVKPATGRLVIWPAGFTHTHRGNPPLTNTKYIITGWFEL
jgi:hypothetical protein